MLPLAGVLTFMAIKRGTAWAAVFVVPAALMSLPAFPVAYGRRRTGPQS